ncbi:methyl-accepting chemotaxis protein [Paenibacillus taihuensis]|uniref:Methyl-accepting chemotaxis protein n=1 Tax=Paenibacillus taihuensis TaxID=1156355 RepID=A0A3D9QVQ3_9BACL|nr:methyl-accepting chemotaxis protein [Paenibacillus taihuensis]REE67306.1 methyl-accepting chemotaxis protein [Paenibacillus taihuensis]
MEAIRKALSVFEIRNYTILRRLNIGFITVLVLMSMVLVTGIWKMHEMERQNVKVRTNWLPELEQLGQIKSGLYEMQLDIMKFHMEKDESKKVESVKSIQSQIKTLASVQRSLQENAPNRDVQSLLVILQQEYQAYADITANFLKKGPDAASTNTEMFNKLTQEFYRSVGQLAKVISYSLQAASSDSASAKQSYHSGLVVMLAIGLLAIAIGLIIAYLIAISIVRPMRMIVSRTQLIAEGDFSGEPLQCDDRGEFALLTRVFNQMNSTLSELFTHFRGNTQQVASSSLTLSGKISHTGQLTEQAAVRMQDVVSNSERQVVSLGECGATISEMSEGMQLIADSVEKAANSSASASELTAEGSLKIQEAIRQMNAIQEKVQMLSISVGALGTKTDEIGTIIQTITEISSQTNLLALNAAIEAARAGEQGRGFAVVAGEVRKLAEQSASSARQIADIVGSIRHEALETEQAMAASSQEVASGVTVIQEAEGAFGKIQSAIGVVAGQTQEISAAVEEVTAGSEQIVVAITDLKHFSETSFELTVGAFSDSEEQLSSMDEIQYAIGQLSDMAESMRANLDKFRVR